MLQKREIVTMRTFRTFRIAATILAVAAGATLAAAENGETERRDPRTTGGTIAGAAAAGTQAGYKSGAVGIDTMVAGVAGITELATIKGEQISNVGSQGHELRHPAQGGQTHQRARKVGHG
jgi:L-asparaginase/Glu-tRNA(Gln) amidotransferase subunit D